jgi:hypothetical protein
MLKTMKKQWFSNVLQGGAMIALSSKPWAIISVID